MPTIGILEAEPALIEIDLSKTALVIIDMLQLFWCWAASVLGNDVT
jgi:hypothetical protein